MHKSHSGRVCVRHAPSILLSCGGGRGRQRPHRQVRIIKRFGQWVQIAPGLQTIAYVKCALRNRADNAAFPPLRAHFIKISLKAREMTRRIAEIYLNSPS